MKTTITKLPFLVVSCLGTNLILRLNGASPCECPVSSCWLHLYTYWVIYTSGQQMMHSFCVVCSVADSYWGVLKLYSPLKHCKEHFQICTTIAIIAFIKLVLTFIFRNTRFCCFTSYTTFALYKISIFASVFLKLQLITALIFEATMSPNIKSSLLRPFTFWYFN